MKKYLLLLSFVLLLTACSTSTQNTGYGDDGLDPNEDDGIPYGDDGLDPNEDDGIPYGDDGLDPNEDKRY